MITTKQFQILTDINPVWKLMTDVYDHAESNGPAAPFFEYAITSPWCDRDYLRLNRFWMDGDNPVAFVFYEQPVNQIYFVLRQHLLKRLKEKGMLLDIMRLTVYLISGRESWTIRLIRDITLWIL